MNEEKVKDMILGLVSVCEMLHERVTALEASIAELEKQPERPDSIERCSYCGLFPHQTCAKSLCLRKVGKAQ